MISGYFFAGSKSCGLTMKTSTGVPSAPFTHIVSAGRMSTASATFWLKDVRRVRAFVARSARQISTGWPTVERVKTTLFWSGLTANSRIAWPSSMRWIFPVATSTRKRGQ
ncbi:hypothetical protein GALL_460400 [mine drainage metagenome]|uniref:Uncharacterized protein n=1 Tax=mine drainage metagenome TaxID=410659 RepID=A0A1J5PLB8_9ZZZZ